LFAVEKTVGNEFAGAESCTFVGLHGLAWFWRWSCGCELDGRIFPRFKREAFIDPSITFHTLEITK
jgi:hypothetical protein